MSSALDVFLHERRVGRLERRSQARLEFRYLPEALDGEACPPLSLSLPPRPEPYSDEECEPFFAGLLPEGEFLKAVARAFHVSAENAFGLLAAIGGECAGAVSLAEVDGPPPGRETAPPRWLDRDDLARLLDSLPERPLLVAADEELDDDDGIRLSLAGTVDKLGVLVDGDRIAITRGHPPTNHILKTPIASLPETIANEAFCMTLAVEAGLDAAEVEPWSEPRPFLLVRRYDRGPGAPDGRLHQEDFCQALGFPPALKYEREGGPDVARCAELLWKHSSAPAPDVISFLDALLFNFLIANHDAHSKNYSLLLEPEGVRIAPLYDLLSTAVYQGLSRKLAMRYGGEYRPAYLRGRHLERLADQLQVRKALVRERALRTGAAVRETVGAARGRLPDEFAAAEVIDSIVATIEERDERLRGAVAEM